MRENLTELVFILDKSGSMSGLESDTIGGFNSMIDRHRSEESEVLVSTILFSDNSEVVHDRVNIQDVPKLTHKEYYVGGSTALLDAVGDAVKHIANIHKYAREEDRPAKTLFVITTDGMENSSNRYRFKDVKRLIERKKEKDGWEFLFLGANIDAVEVAGSMGINEDRAANYHCDSAGTAINYCALSKAVGSVISARGCASEALEDNGWREDIDKDFKRRK